MRSSCLLIKMFRWRLALCVAALVDCTFLAVQMRQDDFLATYAEHFGMSLGFYVMYFLAVSVLLLAWSMRMHPRLYELPYPITQRQTAYVPLAVAGFLWLTGLGCVVGVLIHRTLAGEFTLADWAPFWWEELKALPVAAAFVIAGLWAIGGRWQSMFAFLYLLPLPLAAHLCAGPWIHRLVQAYSVGWPLVIAGCVFYVVTMPRYFAGVRRSLTKHTRAGFSTVVRDDRAPERSCVTFLLGDAGIAVSLGTVFIVFISSLPSSEASHFPAGMAALVAAIFVMWTGVAFLSRLQQFARANALKPGGLALGLAMWAAAFNDSWGLSEQAVGPAVAVCPRCLRRVFVWHVACPHCGQAQPASARVGKAVEPRGIVRGGRWLARILAGAVIPASALLFAWSLGTSLVIVRMLPAILSLRADTVDTEAFDDLEAFVSGPFTQDYVALSLGQIAAGEERDKALKQLQEVLMAEPKPLAWIRAKNTDVTDVEHVPERFRIEAIRADDEHLVILALGLRWDRPDALAEGLAQYLISRLGGEFPFELDPDYAYSWESPPYLLRASFLDNRVHWVDPARPSAGKVSPAMEESTWAPVSGSEEGETCVRFVDFGETSASFRSRSARPSCPVPAMQELPNLIRSSRRDGARIAQDERSEVLGPLRPEATSPVGTTEVLARGLSRPYGTGRKGARRSQECLLGYFQPSATRTGSVEYREKNDIVYGPPQ